MNSSDASADRPDEPLPDRECPWLSVVFSFYNESEVLPELLSRTRRTLDQLCALGRLRGYELIFVNDASTDDSEALLHQAARSCPQIRLVNMSRNFGVSPCVLAGMRRASGDAVVYLDADLQDPPELISQLLAAWQARPEVEVVHTVRRSRAGESLTKKLITRIGYAILRSVSTIDLPLEAGDFKLLSRRAVRQVLRFREKRPFLRGLICWIGFPQDVVYYHREPRAAGITKFPVLGTKVIRNFIDSAVIAFSDVPLKLSTALGLVCSGTALCALVAMAAAWGQGMELPAWSATLVAILFLGGTQLLSIGILGNYIGSIFLESKRRPNYIVKDTFGFPKPSPRRKVAHERVA